MAERGAGARTKGGHGRSTCWERREGHRAALRRKAPLLLELAPTPTLQPSLLAGKGGARLQTRCAGEGPYGACWGEAVEGKRSRRRQQAEDEAMHARKIERREEAATT